MASATRTFKEFKAMNWGQSQFEQALYA
jgi:hypothetical protein